MAMVDGLVTMMFLTIDDVLTGREKPRRGETLLTGKYPWYNIYETKDGKYVSVGAIEPWFYANLCRLLGREELAPHQYADDDKQQEVFAAFREAFLTKTRDEWVEQLDARRDLRRARARHRRSRRQRTPAPSRHDHRGRRPHAGRARWSSSPKRPRPFAARAAPIRTTRPALLRELGYDDARIEELRRADAIA